MQIPECPLEVGEEEMRRLGKAVRENSPRQYKFAFGLRTLLLVAILIDHEFGEKISLAPVSTRGVFCCMFGGPVNGDVFTGILKTFAARR